jgi:hypothetical protein
MKVELSYRILSRRHFLAGTVAGTVCSAAGCGTILYPERRGQGVGQLDWGVVMLDGIGLILFFIPGLIAFAVDFSTGAIYLPPREEYQLSSANKPTALKRVTVEAKPLSPAGIAHAVSAETGQSVTLEEGTYFTTELSDLDRFWLERDRLAAAHDGQPTRFGHL